MPLLRRTACPRPTRRAAPRLPLSRARCLSSRMNRAASFLSPRRRRSWRSGTGRSTSSAAWRASRSPPGVVPSSSPPSFSPASPTPRANHRAVQQIPRRSPRTPHRSPPRPRRSPRSRRRSPPRPRRPALPVSPTSPPTIPRRCQPGWRRLPRCARRSHRSARPPIRRPSSRSARRLSSGRIPWRGFATTSSTRGSSTPTCAGSSGSGNRLRGGRGVCSPRSLPCASIATSGSTPLMTGPAIGSRCPHAGRGTSCRSAAVSAICRSWPTPAGAASCRGARPAS